MTGTASKSPNSSTTLHNRVVLRTERALAILNGGLAGLALFVVGAMAVLLVLVLLPGGGGGGPWGGMGVATAIGFLVYAVCVSLVTVIPLSIWMLLNARWLWQGDPRGRKAVVVIAWIVAGGTLLLGTCTWFMAREPLVYVAYGTLPAIYATVHLLCLQRSRVSLAISGVMIGMIFISLGAHLVGQHRVGNPGGIECPIEHGITILTATDDVVCIGPESSPATHENILLAWNFKTGERADRKPFPRMDKYDICRQAGLLAAVVEGDPGHFAHLVVCRLPSGEQFARLPNVIKTGGCSGIKLSPQGDRVAVVWGPGKADVYAVPDGQLLRSFQATASLMPDISQLAFDPRGELLIVATEKELALWSVAEAEDSPRWRTAATWVLNLWVVEQAKRLMVATRNDLFSVDLATGQIGTRHPYPNLDHFSICGSDFSSDGRSFAIIRQDGVVTLWDTDTGETRDLAWGKHVGHGLAAMNLDTMHLVAGSPTPGIVWLRRWDVAQKIELRDFAQIPVK